MRTRSALLSAGVALAAVAIPSFAQDQEIPCPTEQLVQQARQKNDAKSKPKPEDFYQQLRENYDQQCRIAKQELAALKPKFKEYEDGKRNDRDGYVILRKLTWQYQVLRAENHPDARPLSQKMRALEKKNPKLRDIQDEQLAEDVAAKKKESDSIAAQKRAAEQWTPPDSDPISEYAGEGFKIVVYQFKVEFFRAGQSAPVKVMSFKHRVLTSPDSMNFASDSGSNLLVCTRQDAGYSARTQEEERMIHLRGHARRRMPWTNPRGTHGSFCGIVNSSGDVIYEFPGEQHPSQVYVPLGMAGKGKRAAVKVGSFVRQKQIEGDDSERIDTISNFKEVWIWEHPNTIRKVKITKDDLWGNRLIKRLRDGKL